MKFVVLGAFLLLQVFTVTLADAISVPFYSLLANATGKCNEVNHTGINNLDVTVTFPMDNVTQIVLSNIQVEKVNITSAEIFVTASGDKFNVTVKATADNETQTTSFDITKKGEMKWKNNANGGKFEQIRVNGGQFQGNSTHVKSCLDVGLVYEGPNKTNHITLVSLGCCEWNNGTQITCVPAANNTLENWAKDISSNICNGAFSSLHITPIFALLLAVFVSFLNKL